LRSYEKKVGRKKVPLSARENRKHQRCFQAFQNDLDAIHRFFTRGSYGLVFTEDFTEPGTIHHKHYIVYGTIQQLVTM